MASRSGTNGDDELIGSSGDDQLCGKGGADLLEGRAGNDKLHGNRGNDHLDGGDGNDWLHGGTHDDQLFGGAGNDRLDGGTQNDRLFGGAGNDRLYGSHGNDHLEGGDGNDWLHGGTHDDQLFGGDGDDRLDGGTQNDRLFGGAGKDKLYGGHGNDHLDGGDGDDRLFGNGSSDTLLGGAGNDQLHGGTHDDQLFGGDGDDRLDGGTQDDQLFGDAGNDRLYGSHGNDRLEGGDGDDWLHGGTHDDQLFGGAGNDRLDGGTQDDQLFGGAGKDKLYGGHGNDHLEGGDGDDTLNGGIGNDLFVQRMGDGNDQIDGHAGTDTIQLEADDGWVLDLSKGRVVSDQDGQMQLSNGAAGTIKLADGSTIRFKGIERIEQIEGAGEPDDDNQAPGDLNLVAEPITENARDGSLVGTAVASGPDAVVALASVEPSAGGLSYALTDDADGRFAIDPDTGEITVVDGSRLDYEEAAQHGIEVEVTNANGLRTTKAFTIDVADINEAPSVLELSASEVAEDAAGGTVVGTVGASDPDTGDKLTYALTDDAGGRFAIDPHTGVISVASQESGGSQEPLASWQLDRSFDGHDQNVVIDHDASFQLDRGTVLLSFTPNQVSGRQGLFSKDSLGFDAGGHLSVWLEGDQVVARLQSDNESYHLYSDPGAVAAGEQVEVAVSFGDEGFRLYVGGELVDQSSYTGGIADNGEPLVIGADAQRSGDGTADNLKNFFDGTIHDLAVYGDQRGGEQPPAASKASLDHASAVEPASAAQHTVEVEVTDAGGLSATKTFTIDVTGVNDAPSILELSASEVAEDADGGTVVGTVGASDPDVGDTLTFALTDDAGGRFAIDPSTGVISVADGASFDHDDAAQHSIEVEVTDSGGLSTTKSFAISVADVNEAPGALALDASEVAEGAGAGTVVGTLSASDPNTGDSLTFALTDDVGGRFAIDPSTGVITVADGTLLDHESAPQHSIEVQVTDAGGLSTFETFTIDVTNVNEAPGALALDASEVAEAAVDGTVVGTVSASDPDAGDSLTYALTDDAGGRFAIEPSTGVITVADGTLLDHESAAQHSIEVEVTDAGGLSTTQTFTIEVGDVNEAPSVLELSASEVAEDAAGGTVVGTVMASDPDAGDSLTFALTDDAGGRFAIDPGTGVITLVDGAPLDYDTDDQHGITVEVTDAGGLSATQSFTIAVGEANQAPGELGLNGGAVAEGALEGTVVGTVSAIDPNSGDTLTYSLTDDAGGRFAIDPSTGVITVVDSAPLDHETSDQHNIEVKVTDAGGLNATQSFTIAVSDVNETPGALDLDAGEVAENATGGTVVGTVSASDPDAGDTLSYALADDAGGRFAIDTDTGVVTVAEGAALDHESAAQHGIEVEVTDAGGLSTTRTFAIDVSNVNEAPGAVSLDTSEVAEGAGAGTVVGTVSAADPDAGDVFSYALTDDAGGRFVIDPDTGVITVAEDAALDHESASQHGIEVEVTDTGGLSATQTFTIDVTDGNEAPGTLDLDASQVTEGAGAGTVIGTVSAADPDAGDTVSYALTEDAGGRFAIDPDTGVITVADGTLLDHESASQHSIEVEVTDAGGLSATKAFTIDVTDANEAPGALDLDASEVVEDATGGTVVGTVSASDPDADDTLTYSLTDDADGRFVIDPDSGVITVADGEALDHESAAQHGIEVKVTDAGGLSTTKTFTIDVTGVNDAPSILQLSASEVAEDAAGGTVVGTVGASDPNAGDTLSYALTDDAGGRFAIHPDSGVITVADGEALDHESASQHNIEVEVTDTGGLSATQTFTIDVANANEAPGALDLDASEVAENAAAGTVVGTVSASDPDAGDTLTYALTDDAGGRFAIDPDTGVITVVEGATLDHETSNQHNIEVEVTDAEGLSATRIFAIAVTDANEAPGTLELDSSEVAENAAAGTVVGTVGASDPDAGDTLTYALIDDAGGRFVVDPDSGEIIVAEGATFDHDDAAQHSIEVEVTDAGGLSATATFQIAVTGVNDAPSIGGLSASEVAEGAGEGTVIGTVAASDPDAGDSLTYALSNDAGGRFTIDPDSGAISVSDGSLLDHENATQHDIEVEVTDAEGLTATRSFTIAVMNVNEAPGIIDLDANEVAEDAAGGTVVGTVGASDTDAGDMLSYALTDDAGGRFVINPVTGVISVATDGALDHENAMQHVIGVEVTDAGGLSASQTFMIAVTNVNERPVLEEISANKVVEEAADGTVIGTVSALDPDGVSALTFALTDDAGGRFAIDPDTGVVRVADGTLLDYDSANQHGIEVTVTDPGGLSHVATYVIEVQKDNSGDDAFNGDDDPNTIDGGAGDDLIFGAGGDDTLIGGDGDDFLFGENDDDDLFGDAGVDQLYGGGGDDELFGGADSDELFGSIGEDKLFGGDGDDFLFGGAHDDELVGGAGDDILNGGAGGDRFVFAGPDEGVDRIADFGAGDVLAIGVADLPAGGDEGSFVRLVDDGTDTTVEVDVDGAANGEDYQPIAVLDNVTGVTLNDLVSASQIDFWLS